MEVHGTDFLGNTFLKDEQKLTRKMQTKQEKCPNKGNSTADTRKKREEEGKRKREREGKTQVWRIKGKSGLLKYEVLKDHDGPEES